MKNNVKRAGATALLLALVAVAALLSPTVFVAGPAKSHESAAAGTRWMQTLDGTKLLSQFSLPGTHNSGALFEPIRGTAKCQNLNIPAQLNAGVRFLDIRCRHRNNAFDIYHGPIYQKDNFAGVVSDATDFLRVHPSETIILSVQETAGAENNTRSFEATFTDYIARNPAPWLLGSAVPTLNQARGKIVLLRRFDAATAPGIDAANWSDNSTFTSGNLRVQDQYQVGDSDDKWSSIENLLKQTRAEKNPPLTLNFCSGVKLGWLGIPNVPSVANEINPRLAQFFASQPRGNFGVVIVDFADPKLCAAIYRTN